MKIKRIVVLVLIIIVLGSCIGYTTFALLNSEGKGTANVNAAKWDIKVNNTSITTNSNTFNLGTLTWTNSLGTNVVSGKIAPGSTTTFNIVIDGSLNETSIDYRVIVEDIDNLPGFTVSVGDNNNLQTGTINYSSTASNMVKTVPVTVTWNGASTDSETKNISDLSYKANNLILTVKVVTGQILDSLKLITFNSNGGSSVSSKLVENNSKLTNLPISVKEGYNLVGWFTAVSGGTQLTTNTTITSDVTYIARWEAKTVTVTLDPNGGTLASLTSNQTYGSTYNLPTPTNTLEFLGWNTKKNGTGTMVTSSTTVNTIKAHTLYAIYKEVWNFDYNGTDGTTGSVQEFVAPYSGTYKLETWGAQGGSYNNTPVGSDEILVGGYGGYSTGNILLNKNEKLFLYIGGEGLTSYLSLNNNGKSFGGYNGGGKANGGICNNYSFRYSSSGGGATHITTTNRGVLSNYAAYKNDILVVSGGGGGSYYQYNLLNENSDTIINTGSYGSGGSGGGYIGVTAQYINSTHSIIDYATGGTQSSAGHNGNSYNTDTPDFSGTFGTGGRTSSPGDCSNVSGGGAGYYGGGSGRFAPGAGGSGYLKSTLTNKAMYCYKCEESSDPNTYTVSTYGDTTHASERDTTNCPNGYSSNPISKCAKAGHGYARITLVSLN